MAKTKTARNERLLAEVAKGRSQAAIARQYHMTRARVHAIVARARQRTRLLVVVEPLVEAPDKDEAPTAETAEAKGKG